MNYFVGLSEMIDLFGLETAEKLTLVHGGSLADKHVPGFPPDIPALIINPGRGDNLVSLLRAVYPAGHVVRGLLPGTRLVELSLDDLVKVEELAALLVPPLDEFTSFESFQEIIAHLRAPEGCPWDREQTHLTLRKHLLEEAYEALDAIDAQDAAMMREEFGDLLLQVVLHAQIASEMGEFGMADVIRGVNDKIIRRHPHVFGSVQVDGVGQVLSNWEKLKADERKANGTEAKGLLDGLPAALPALSLAHEIQDRVARVGFDWPSLDGVLDKICEEVEEVRAATDEAALVAELGDLFFALVNFARWKKVDAEFALREANLRFRRRFAYVEQQSRAQGVTLNQMSLDALEALWQAAKQNGL
ncbi:MAG: nucleoside triphosphate pyrophosphohydrolase [Anaerolineales bacterium]